jgi:preprotein translocase subunit SecB
MANDITVEEGDYAVVMRRLFLDHVHFLDRTQGEEPQSPTAGTAVQVSLGLTRLSASRMIVALSAANAEDAPYQVSVTYAAEYEALKELPEEELDRVWRHLAVQIAPGVLYPYLRELITNLTSRSAAYTLNLPLIPLPLGIQEEDLQLPEITGDRAEMDLFPDTATG